MSDEHRSCKNLKVSIQQYPDRVVLLLVDPLSMREIKCGCEISQSKSPLSRRYHIQESMVIGMRRLVALAIEKGMVSISLSGSLGALGPADALPPVKWEPHEDEDSDSLMPF
jgi:hypothetical protein